MNITGALLCLALATPALDDLECPGCEKTTPIVKQTIDQQTAGGGTTQTGYWHVLGCSVSSAFFITSNYSGQCWKPITEPGGPLGVDACVEEYPCTAEYFHNYHYWLSTIIPCEINWKLHRDVCGARYTDDGTWSEVLPGPGGNQGDLLAFNGVVAIRCGLECAVNTMLELSVRNSYVTGADGWIRTEFDHRCTPCDGGIIVVPPQGG